MPSTVLALSTLLALSSGAPGHAFAAAVEEIAEPEPHPSWNEPSPEEPAAPEEAPPAGDEPGTESPPGDPAEATVEPGDPAEATEAPGDPAEAAAPPEGTEAEAEAEPVEAAPPTVPEQKGLGLMITAGALGAAGWGVMGWRMSIVKNGCQSDTTLETVTVDDVGDLVGDGFGCLGAKLKAGAAWFLQAGPNSANWVIAPIAGSTRAKYDAARFVLEDGPERKPNVFIGVGAGILGAGVIGRIVVFYIRTRAFRDPAHSYVVGCISDDMTTTPDEFFDCYARKNMLHFFGHQITSAGIAAGAGLLTYGLVYKKGVKDYGEGKGGEQARLRLDITPQLSLHHTGVSASLRF